MYLFFLVFFFGITSIKLVFFITNIMDMEIYSWNHDLKRMISKEIQRENLNDKSPTFLFVFVHFFLFLLQKKNIILMVTKYHYQMII